MATTGIRSEPPLVVIVGPTASGKTALAIDLAQRYSGEIICADSRTIYKDMDVGTAKPTAAEQQIVPHWGLNLVLPGERFTAADFKEYAENKIKEIRGRGNIPFLVGGTGLYSDAVLFNYQFGDNADPVIRQKLEAWSVEELQEYCIKSNIMLPENKNNKRYIIRAIEQNGINNRRQLDPIQNSIVVGIATERNELRTRIECRAEQLFADGVVEEAKMLGKKYGWNNEAMTGNVYPLVHHYLQGALTLAEVKQKFVTLDWRLAKRQLTWLKRNKHIIWLSREAASDNLVQALENWRHS